MTNIVLPTSPNWYLSQISDSNRGGYYVFGARHDVVVFDVSKVPTSPPVFINSYSGHRDRVTAVCLGQTQSQLDWCCSTSDDLKVKLWDINTHVEIQSHTEHTEKITALSWSQSQRDLIVSGDERGTIIRWSYTSNERQSFRHEKDHIFTLACCNHNSALLAVGYKSGNILVLDISHQGRIVHRLRGHDDEVHCVLWCPVPGDKVLSEGAYSQSDESRAYLIASGSRDRTIRIWNTSQGKQLQVKKLPVNTGHRRDVSDGMGRGKVWTTLYWPRDNPTQLVSSSFSGELIMWDLSPVGHSREIFQAGDSRLHSRVVFNICAGGEEMDTLFTVGMDRMIVLWSLERQCSLFSIPSLGGHIYKIEVSPLDPGRIAIGVGDNMIRVWNTNNKTNPYDINTIWQGVKSKVTALCWHPHKEKQLGFGTDDGRVGIFDVMSNKHPTLSSTFHRRTVYAVAFGPSSVSQDERGESGGVSLYSVGDMVVLEHRLTDLSKDAININKLIESVNGKSTNSSMRSDMCWRPDESVVAISSDDGCVEIYQAGTFKLLCVVHVHRKLINCLRWHPIYTGDAPQGSECKYWLATGANDAVVHVVNLSNALESPRESVGRLSESMRKLEGHSIRVTGISWNPHVEGQLVSVGYDGVAYVWNVKTGEALHQFEGHIQRLLCVAWSGTDPDEIMSGGFDSTLHRWKVSSQPRAVIELGKKKKKKKKSDYQCEKSSTKETNIPSSASSTTEGDIPIVDLESGADNPNKTESQSKNVNMASNNETNQNVDTARSNETKPEKEAPKRMKERKKKDYQDELAELREMLESRKQQILKEQKTHGQKEADKQTPIQKELDKQTQVQKGAEKQNSTQNEAEKTVKDEKLTLSGGGDAQKGSEIVKTVEPGQDGDNFGLRGEKGRGEYSHGDYKKRKSTKEETEDDDCRDGEEDLEKILGSRYVTDEKRDDSLCREDGGKKDLTVRDFAGSKKRRGRAKSVFPASAREENRGKAATLDDLLLLTGLNVSDTHPVDLPDDKFHLGLFTDRRGTYKCLKKEGEHHLKNDNMEYSIQLEIWKGNIGGALQIARDREELSDWLVGLAPLASHDTWVCACEEYGRQLEGDGQYHKAATYLLAAHKVYDAIDLFKRHKLFKEAVSLARVRLSPLDPVLEDLYMEWAQTLMKDGNYEQGAKCYLAMKQIQDAANMLTKRTDQLSLKTATHMTVMGDQKPQAFLYAHRLVHQFIAKDDWKQGYKFLKEHDVLKMLLPFVSMHELLMKELQVLTPGTLREVDPDCFTQWTDSPSGKTFIPEFILDVTECDPVLPWKPYMIHEHSFPHHVLKVWYFNLDIAMDSESLTLMYKTLQQHQSGRQSHIDPQQLMFQVCMDLTLSLLAVLIGETSASINHLLHAVSTLHTVGQFDLMEAICQLMLPLGPKYLLKLQQEATALRVLISMEAHLEVEGAGKAPSLKRYLTEIKDDDSISTTGLRCRELDCLRAYYYLAVLNFLKQSIREDSALGQPEEASVDDDFKVRASQDLEQQRSAESADPASVGSAAGLVNAVSNDVAENGGKDGNSRVDGTTSGGSKKENVKVNSVEKADVVNGDKDVKDIAVTSDKSDSELCVSLGQGCVKNESDKSGDSKVGVAEEASGTEGTNSQDSSVTHSGQGSSLGSETKTNNPDQINQQNECQNEGNPKKLTISKLKQISRGLLWDIQAKKHSLTETLGYIHKAISKHLLADKSKDHHHSVVFDHVSQPRRGNSEQTVNRDNLSLPSDTQTDQAPAQPPVPNGLQTDLFSPDLVPDTVDPNEIEVTGLNGSDLFSKSRKVLWEDEPHLYDTLDSRPRDSNCFLNPAKYINVPDEWYGMPADEKYFRPYVTMAVLQQEQEYVMHELKKVPDISVVCFPNPFESVDVLLAVCKQCSMFTKQIKDVYTNQVALWALHFAVTSHQRKELMKLITEPPVKKENNKVETSV